MEYQGIGIDLVIGQLRLKGLIYKNLQNAAEGGMAPRPMIPTAVITPAVIPPSAAYIGFLQVFTEKPF